MIRVPYIDDFASEQISSRKVVDKGTKTLVKTFDDIVKSGNPDEYLEDRLMDRTEVKFKHTCL